MKEISKYIASDIENGLSYLKVGLNNMIDDIIINHSNYEFKNIPINLVKDCVISKNYKLSQVSTNHYIVKDKLNNELISIIDNGTTKFSCLIS